MRKALAIDEIRDLLAPGTEFHPAGADQFCVPAAEDGVQIDFRYPTALPIGRDGNPFVVGSGYLSLNRSHPLYAALGLASHAHIYLHAGDFDERIGDQRDRLSFRDVAEATSVAVIANWEKGHEPTLPGGLDSDFAKRVHAVYYDRIEIADENRYNADVWVFPIHTDACRELLGGALYDMAKIDATEEAAGEVFENTRRAIVPIMRAYTDDFLFPRLEDLEYYTFAYHGGKVTLIFCPDFDKAENYVVDTFPLTLDGTQQLAALIEEIAFRQKYTGKP